jgi:hypothetical protein
MTQQPLSGAEVYNIAKLIVELSKRTDMNLEAVIASVLADYILVPKYKTKL